MAKFEYHIPDHKITHNTVTLTDLRADHSYQRDCDPCRVRNMVKTLVPSAVGVITVSARDDGTLWVLDGQHRVEACKTLEFTQLPAEIHHGLTVDQEAGLFLIKNVEAKGLAPVDEFRTGIRHNVPEYCEIQKVLNKYGLTVTKSNSSSTLSAVRSVQALVKQYDTEALDRALDILEQAFGRTARTWDGSFIGGLGMLIGRYPDVDDRRLIKVLKLQTPESLMLKVNVISASRAGSSGSKRQAARDVIVALHDKGMQKNRLVPKPEDDEA